MTSLKEQLGGREMHIIDGTRVEHVRCALYGDLVFFLSLLEGSLSLVRHLLSPFVLFFKSAPQVVAKLLGCHGEQNFKVFSSLVCLNFGY